MILVRGIGQVVGGNAATMAVIAAGADCVSTGTCNPIAAPLTASQLTNLSAQNAAFFGAPGPLGDWLNQNQSTVWWIVGGLLTFALLRGRG